MAKKRAINHRGTRPGVVVKFTQEAADSLPSGAPVSHFARALGISKTILCRWRKLGYFEAYWQTGGRYVGTLLIDKSSFLQWAQNTGRFDGEIRNVIGDDEYFAKCAGSARTYVKPNQNSVPVRTKSERVPITIPEPDYFDKEALDVLCRKLKFIDYKFVLPSWAEFLTAEEEFDALLSMQKGDCTLADVIELRRREGRGTEDDRLR